MVRQNLVEGNQRGHDEVREVGPKRGTSNERIQVSAAEPIPGAANRLHDIAAELLAKIAHVDLHHVGGRTAVVSPDVIERARSPSISLRSRLPREQRTAGGRV
jgi:hypothetical protein